VRRWGGSTIRIMSELITRLADARSTLALRRGSCLQARQCADPFLV